MKVVSSRTATAFFINFLPGAEIITAPAALNPALMARHDATDGGQVQLTTDYG
jgi:hypothetical protein